VAEKKTARQSKRSSARKSTTAAKKSGGPVLTAEERAAMRETVKERKAARNQAEEEAAVLEKIAEMHGTDRAMAKRIHEIVKANAPSLSPRTWYGMPAYAKDGKVVCFFKAAEKFDSRYATFGFEDAAKIDAGAMWPTSFALTKLTAADEKKIGALVKKAAR
jgi:uncharacterized protein YdhG (YjbR/CyaY superfamily)